MGGANKHPKLDEKTSMMSSMVAANSQEEETGDFAEIKRTLRKMQDSHGVYMGNHTVLTKLYTGQKIFVDTNDVSEAPHLILDGFWEEDITKAFMRIVRPGDTVFDAGSTFGYYGLLAGSITNKDSNVGSLHFFDPNEVYEPYVRKSLRVNGLLECSKVNTLGLSGDGKSVKIQEFKDDWNSNTTVTMEEFKKHRTLTDDYVVKTIHTTTLDDYCEKNSIKSIDVLKMDIEGMEQPAYKGAKNIIKNSPRLKLVMEFTPDYYDNAEKFFEQIASDFDYLYTISQRGSLAPLTDYKQIGQRIRKGNWLMMIASKERV